MWKFTVLQHVVMLYYIDIFLGASHKPQFVKFWGLFYSCCKAKCLLDDVRIVINLGQMGLQGHSGRFSVYRKEDHLVF